MLVIQSIENTLISFADLALIKKAEVSLIYEEFKNFEFMQANNKFFKNFIEFF